MALSSNEKALSIIKRNNIKNNGDINYLNSLHSLRTKNKLESHKKICENKNFCNVVMSYVDTKILEFNQFVSYAGLECLMENIDGCKNNPKNSSASTIYQVFQCLQYRHLKA